MEDPRSRMEERSYTMSSELRRYRVVFPQKVLNCLADTLEWSSWPTSVDPSSECMVGHIDQVFPLFVLGYQMIKTIVHILRDEDSQHRQRGRFETCLRDTRSDKL